MGGMIQESNMDVNRNRKASAQTSPHACDQTTFEGHREHVKLSSQPPRLSDTDDIAVGLEAAVIAAGTHHGHLHPPHSLQRRHQLGSMAMADHQGDSMAGPAMGCEVLLLWSEQQERSHNAWQSDSGDSKLERQA